VLHNLSGRSGEPVPRHHRQSITETSSRPGIAIDHLAAVLPGMSHTPTQGQRSQATRGLDNLFEANRMLIAEITPEVVASATTLRARYGFKTPDAIHLASAIEEKADLFLTGDSSLARCTEIVVEVLESR
jgi:predicted nucleic acid-binding protein